MSATVGGTTALGDSAARQLANATKTVAQLSTISPRWLTHLLQWVPVEAGIYRLNRVKNPEAIKVACTAKESENQLPRTFVDYEENPRGYHLNAVSTVLDVHTRVSDLYSSPHDQIKEQLRLTIETIKENQESELINNPDYGLLAQVTDEQRIFPLTGAPTPDDLDELLTKVWKEPAFFLAHPLAIAAFGREATRRGTPPPTVSLFGSQFITWRGIPLIPSNKIPVADGKSKILLLRVLLCGRVVVSVPLGVPEHELRRFRDENHAWILRAQQRMPKLRQRLRNRCGQSLARTSPWRRRPRQFPP